MYFEKYLEQTVYGYISAPTHYQSHKRGCSHYEANLMKQNQNNHPEIFQYSLIMLSLQKNPAKKQHFRNLAERGKSEITFLAFRCLIIQSLRVGRIIKARETLEVNTFSKIIQNNPKYNPCHHIPAF